MSVLVPHDFQLKAARELWISFNRNNHRATVLQAPTGAGKTIIGSFFTSKMLEHGKWRTLVLAHRREIIDQTVEKLRMMGLPTGVIMAGRKADFSRPVQVASVDTLDSWVSREHCDWPTANMLWIDEAHRAMGARYQRIIQHYIQQGACLLGTTATPIRTDGVGLGRTFTHMVRTPDIRWMIDNGFLVPVQYRVGLIPDVKGVRIAANGDYDPRQLQAAVDQKVLVGNVVDQWMRHAKGRPTMVFAAGVDHSVHIAESFRAAGVKCAHIDASTPIEERESVKAAIYSGDLQVITNAAVYVEGTDIPPISCISMAKPTKSLGMYLQCIGRGMRTSPGKSDLLVLDHAGVVYRHGRAEMDHEWIITEGREMLEKHAARLGKQLVSFHCPSCDTLYSGPSCPSCGHHTETKGMPMPYLDAELVTLTNDDLARHSIPKKKHTKEDKSDWYAQLLYYATERGKRHGWVAHTYRDKFKVWPKNMGDVKPVPPGKDVLGFIHHKNIAYAKRRQANA
jgi:superfamily II DNA or RNA helicase